MNKFLINFYQPLFSIIYIFSLLIGLVTIDISSATAENLSNHLLKQAPIEITVSLGNTDNELKFEPNRLEFAVGKRYNLKLKNPSSQKHYFTAKDFADAIWTQKVEAGNVEIKGNIRELELKPGAEAEWIFVPVKAGKYALRCIIPGHTEAGMKGEIVIR
ncbi:MAG: cupredoxin domain-containing protein [Cuspidothrix sp.]